MMDIDPNRPEPQQGSERPLNLSDFAQRNQITEDRVWELIEEGELAARFVNDEILILKEQDHPGEPPVDLHEAPAITRLAVSDVLPADPVLAPAAVKTESFSESLPEAEMTIGESPEPLSEDHRDLLLFAQDAMNRTMDLSRQLLATKDELIRVKDERVQQLQLEQQRNEQEIRRLRKKVEDLETLCRLTPNL